MQYYTYCRRHASALLPLLHRGTCLLFPISRDQSIQISRRCLAKTRKRGGTACVAVWSADPSSGTRGLPLPGGEIPRPEAAFFVPLHDQGSGAQSFASADAGARQFLSRRRRSHSARSAPCGRFRASTPRVGSEGRLRWPGPDGSGRPAAETESKSPPGRSESSPLG